MYCPFCESEGSDERAEGQTGALTLCPNCGGQVEVRAPQAQTDWTRVGGGPLSFSPPPPSRLLLVGIGKGGRILLGPGVQVGLPPWRAP